MNGKQKIYRLLYPAAFCYGLGVKFRNLLFEWGWLKSHSFDLPVITVGNLTVGGTGKTPHTEYLIRLLLSQYRLAVLSRGYKRKSKGFVLSTTDTPMQMIGDEPFQMKQKFPQVEVAVDANRCEGIELIREQRTDTQLVLLDDAFQHRYLKAGLSIVLVNYERPVWSDALLPAGRLREPIQGIKRADVVVVSKCPKDCDDAVFSRFTKQLHLESHQHLFFSAMSYSDLVPLYSPFATPCPLSSITPDYTVFILTGIASPHALQQEVLRFTSRVELFSFPDHYYFTVDDLQKIEKQFATVEGKKMIITTEKDASRLRSDASLVADKLKPFMYVLPVEVAFLRGQQEEFDALILDYVSKNLNHRN